MNKHDRRTACRRFNSIFVFSFLILVLFNILHKPAVYSELENRYLQTLPSFSIKSIVSGQYMKDMENYVNDHFTFRNFFVGLKSKIEYLSGKKENNGVYICSDGYLMEKPPLTDDGRITENIASIKALNDTGRYNVYATVVPPAYEILKNKLPNHVYRDTVLKLNTRLTAAFQGSGISYCDPTELLRKHSEDYLYFRTDHHMTAHGSYVMYHALSKILNFEPLGSDDFKISECADEFYGTTYSKALKKTTPDVITDYRPLETPRFKVRFPYEGTETDSMYFPAHLKEKDKYSYFLDGNHGLTVVESPNKNGKHLAVFKDSYAHSIVPFLANHFETIHMIDLRYYNEDIIQYMGDHNIKDVLFLYSTATFMTDESLQKVKEFSENSPYFIQRSGLVHTSKPVDNSYFQNTAFVGDSLTDAFQVYANLPEATFLCGTSMTVQGLNSRSAPGGGTIMERIQKGGFQNVYIMLGANEHLIPTNRSKILERYSNFVDTVKAHNPGANIYLQSVLPVTKEAEEKTYLKNDEIRTFNNALLKMAEEKQIYYLDVYSALCDAKQNLPENASTDGTHLNKEYYLKWLDYLRTHAVRAGKTDSKIVTHETPVESEVDVAGLAKSICETVQFRDDLGEISTRMLYSTYGLEEVKMANAAGYRGGGATAEEIAVFEVKDSHALSYVKKKAEEYVEKRKESFKNYIPGEMPKLNKPFYYEKDKILIVCVADHYDGLENKIKAFLK